VKTAGPPAAIVLEADRETIRADGKDLSFITVTITDKKGVPVPYADNLVQFVVQGPMTIAGVDNGSETSMESFRADHRKAFNGKCLVILQAGRKGGVTRLTASSEGLKPATVEIVEQ
jgi:beta-galactosidase